MLATISAVELARAQAGAGQAVGAGGVARLAVIICIQHSHLV